MAQVQTNNVSYLFVVSDFARQATTIKDPTSATYLKEGEVAVSGIDNTLITTTASTYTGKDKMQIVETIATGLKKSPVINFKDVDFYKVTPYSAAVNKVVYLGYNMTSGSLENNVLVPATEYQVNVKRLGILDHYVDSYNTWKTFGWYNTTNTANQSLLARGLMKNGVDNFDNPVDRFIKIEMVSDSIATGAGAAVAFTRSSKLAIGSAGHGIIAGNYIKDANDAIYYVESVSTNNIYLEVPYQSASNSTTPTVVTDPTTGAWGIRLTGENKKYDISTIKYTYDKPDFQISVFGFNDTPITYSVAASLGNGTWEEISRLEFESSDMEGQTSFTDYLIPTRKKYAVANTNYDVLLLHGNDSSYTSVITGSPKSPYTILVAIPTTCTQGDAAGSSTVTPGIAKALDLWLTTNTGRTYNETANLT